MHDTSSRTTSISASSDPQHVVRAIARLREAAVDLDTALAFPNIPGLFAAGSGRLRDLSRDLEALLAQLDAMRLQFAEYVQAAEDDARSESP
ncbi:MAG TPA: hypothetical protein VGS80_06915 [Ktedonobacterales bacterium]|nr:hypothetical protein [Ktedonobacterales bacterium]